MDFQTDHLVNISLSKDVALSLAGLVDPTKPENKVYA